MESTDRELIARCLNGHPDDYRLLVERYQRPVRSYALGLSGDGRLADEATHEAFVRAFLGLPRLRKPESLLSWLLGIAGRVVRELQRGRRRHVRLEETATESLAAEEEPADDVPLAQAVASLPEPYRETILLRYDAGLSCREIAVRLNVPVGTVTKRLSRAYEMLRTSLGAEGHHPRIEPRP